VIAFRTTGLLFVTALALAAAERPTLTLERALTLAEQYNPQVSAASARVRGAEAGIETSRAYPNPDFTTLQGYQHARPIATPGVPGILQHYSVSQPLETPSVRRTRRQAAEHFREGQEFGFSGIRLGVRAQVKRAFYDVLHQREEISHAQENLQIVQDLRNRTRVQVDVGELGRLELTRAETEVARAQTLVRSARLQYVSALSALRAFIGAALEPNVEPEGDLDRPITLPAIAELRTSIMHNHPLLQQARAEVERAKSLLSYEQALRVPQPTVYGEYEEQPDLGFVRVGVAIPLPIWNKRKGPIGEATAALTTASSEETQRELELVATLERAYGQYQLATEQVNSFQGGALKEAQAALEAAQAAYRFGERGIIEVLDAQRVLHAVRGDLLDAQYARQSALIDLEEIGAIHSDGGK
jgi:outer membrane protein, heavy metal efflux system